MYNQIDFVNSRLIFNQGTVCGPPTGEGLKKNFGAGNVAIQVLSLTHISMYTDLYMIGRRLRRSSLNKLPQWRRRPRRCSRNEISHQLRHDSMPRFHPTGLRLFSGSCRRSSRSGRPSSSYHVQDCRHRDIWRYTECAGSQTSSQLSKGEDDDYL